MILGSVACPKSLSNFGKPRRNAAPASFFRCDTKTGRPAVFEEEEVGRKRKDGR